MVITLPVCLVVFDLDGVLRHLDPEHTLGVEPCAAVFIDDGPRKVAGACAVGMRGHRFIDVPTCREFLVAEGVLVSAPA